jgi:hypothetical protein
LLTFWFIFKTVWQSLRGLWTGVEGDAKSCSIVATVGLVEFHEK